MKAFLQRNRRTIRIIRTIAGILFGLMIIIDIVLVNLEGKGFPTFSKVIRDNRTELIWFSFFYGGLMAKVFFNRRVDIKAKELSGFIAFMMMVILLFALGQLIPVELGTGYQVLLMVCGGVLAYRVWPQYS
ncbi:hypothetical protein ACUNWD_00655 [Sunxiuqinia sp. A32]|uniref:hypothetical protein n=1 Tax=Sunxiuqinia sp. A32 TaxID=3461496 RepID=UPI0040455481